jgi:hypothetical protein
MKLREYMKTRKGEYSLAETTTAITVDDLDRRVSEQEVEEYLVGEEPDGRQKLHVYAIPSHIHLVTRVAGRIPEV